jgi:hypothetical protein
MINTNCTPFFLVLLTLRKTALLQKLGKFPAFRAIRDSSTYSQQPLIGVYPEPDTSSPH